jgi:MFS family permease
MEVLAGMLAQAAALVWIGALAATTVPYVSLLPAYVLAGVGMGLSLAPVTDAAMSAIAGPQQGQASGVLNTLRQLGGVFGVAILGAAFGLVAPIEGQFLDGFRVAIFVGAGILTIGGLLALLLPGRQVPPQVTEPTLADTSAVPVA